MIHPKRLIKHSVHAASQHLLPRIQKLMRISNTKTTPNTRKDHRNLLKHGTTVNENLERTYILNRFPAGRAPSAVKMAVMGFKNVRPEGPNVSTLPEMFCKDQETMRSCLRCSTAGRCMLREDGSYGTSVCGVWSAAVPLLLHARKLVRLLICCIVLDP